MVTQAEARHKQLMADEESIDKFITEYGSETRYGAHYAELNMAFSRIMKLATLAEEVLSTVDIWRPKQ